MRLDTVPESSSVQPRASGCVNSNYARFIIQGRMFMLRSVLAAASAATLLVGMATYAYSQTPPTPGTPPAANKGGVNVGSLTCNVAGGIGFVFGSSKDLSCLFTRTDGIAEKYTGSIKKFGVDVGFTKEAQMVWLVFAPGNIAPGAVAGSYGGATASGTVGRGRGCQCARRRQQQADHLAARQRRGQHRSERRGRYRRGRTAVRSLGLPASPKRLRGTAGRANLASSCRPPPISI